MITSFKKIGIFLITTVACLASSCQSEPALKIVYEKDNDMINNYTLIAVNPNATWVGSTPNINKDGADALINWLLSSEGSSAIKDYGQKDFGQSLFTLKDDRPVSTATIPTATDATKKIKLSTTTSVKDSGLLGNILPTFEEKYKYSVEVNSAGTGKAIQAAIDGNADLLLVHSKSQEEAFIAKENNYARKVGSFTSERLTFMFNYFVLIGPKDDPAKCSSAKSVKDAFKLISDGKFTFISRGDKSGTHTKEISLWDTSLGITTDAESFKNYTNWYLSANAGMAACLTMAKEKKGYLLSDKATYLTCAKNNFVVTQA